MEKHICCIICMHCIFSMHIIYFRLEGRGKTGTGITFVGEQGEEGCHLVHAITVGSKNL